MSSVLEHLTPEGRFNTRLGIVLFIIYLVIYAGFVVLSAFGPHVMEHPIAFLGGVNLAVAYGFGLILLAFVMALFYMVLCRQSKSTSGRTK